MNGSINPYQRWLGLNVAARPDCYTLLGIAPFEQDVHRIRAASSAALEKASNPGQPEEEAARVTLVREIQSASVCLTDPSQKAAYDQQLRAYYGQNAGTPPQGYSGSSQGYPSSPQGYPSSPQAYSGNSQAYSANPPGGPGQNAPNMPPGGGASATGYYPQSTATSGGIATAEAPSESAGPQLKTTKKSNATAVRAKAKGAKLGMWITVGLLVVAAAGGSYYYFMVMDHTATPPPVAQNDPVNPQPAPTVTPEPEEDPPANRERPRPGRNRPSADELTGAIGGLGNPDDAMAGMEGGMEGSPSEPTPPVPVEPTPEELAQLTTALQDAWQAIGNKQWAAAQAALDDVRQINKTEEGEAQFARTHRLARDLNTFYQAYEAGLENLRSGTELQVGNTQFTVANNDANRLVVRVGGQSKAYERSSIPEGLARAIVWHQLEADDQQKEKVEASVLALSDIADTDYRRKRWTDAGGDLEVLAKLEADKAKYLVASTSPMPAPAGDAGEDVAMSPNEDSPAMDQPASGSNEDAKQNAEQLAVRLTRTLQLLGQRQVDQAMQQLDGADQLVALPAHGEKLARVQMVADHVEQFWQAVQDQLGTLQADTELTVGTMVTSIVEVSREHLILRVSGQNRRYTLADIPAGLAKHLAEQQLGARNPETQMIVGSFILVEPEGDQARVREKWEEAKSSGAEVDDLMRILDDSYELADDLIEQVAIIPEKELAAPGQEFSKRWNAKIKSALRPADRQSLAREMLIEAKQAPDGTPEQFVAFRFALAEAAKGADFQLCTSIIEAWEKRFAIDPWEWQVKVAQLSAGSSTSTIVQKGVAEHAVRMVPKLRDAGQGKLAERLWKIGEDAAKKAREKSLIDALEQLSQSE